jgi:hypothetical protein
MTPQIISVTFTVTVHASGGRFVVPSKAYHALDLTEDRDPIQLWIHSPSGGSFSVIKPMMSGPEICGPDIESHVQPGERILVEASRPPD